MATVHSTLGVVLGKRDRKRFSSGKHTWLIREGENISVQLHSTVVAEARPDGSVRFNSGGYKTLTTKERISEILEMMTQGKVSKRKGHRIPVGEVHLQLYQARGSWYLCRRKWVRVPKEKRRNEWDTHTWKDLQDVPFVDGMVVRADGTVIGGLSESEVRAQKMLRDAVIRFCKEFMSRLSQGKVPPPSGGDCWDCSMVTIDGKSPGDAKQDHDHLKKHLTEGYYVPSMLYNAVKEFPVSKFAGNILWAWTNPEDEEAKKILKQSGEPNSLYTMMRKQIEDSLRKYLFRRFGLAS